MSCIMCGKAAGFNRAIVDVLSGQELGRLCRNCELAYFGRRLELGDVDTTTCAFCDRDGYYAVPTFVANVVESGDRFISKTDHDVTDATPQICEYHVELMEQFDDQAVPPGSTEPETG